MTSLTLRAAAWFAALFLSAGATAQDAVRFADIAGWWAADPVHGGESSRLAMELREHDGKTEARLWLMAIGAYDIGLGEVAITGNAIDTKGLSFPLTWNPETRTLSGRIPAEAAPVYDIPVEFRRAEPVVKPAAKTWDAPRPVVQWTVETGAPVWAGLERGSDGTLYVANEQGVVHAISRDGKRKWKFDTGKAIRAQPRIIGGHLYVNSDSGYLHKLKPDGTEVWRARVGADLPERLPTNAQGTRWDRYGSGVVADGQHLYVASRDKHLYALDAATGRERWRVAAGDIMTATPALHRELVIFADYAGKVQAVAARDGSPRWSFDAKLAVPGDLTVADGRVLVGSRSYDLIALDADTGAEQWRRYYWFSWIESPPAVRDGVVYTGSSDATHVYAVNLRDGALRWKTAVPGYSWQRTAVGEDVIVAGTVGAGAYPGSRAGSLAALDRATGKIRWIHLDPPGDDVAKAHSDWGFGASPVIADGVVYAADLAGRVYALPLEVN